MDFIEVKSVTKEYAKGFYALQDLNFSVDEGDFVSVVGPFGCGKTTLLNLLGGVTEDYSGTIKIKGKAPKEVKKNRKIGYVFQKPTLLPWRNVIQNITLPQEIAGIKDEQRAYHLLEKVKLGGLSLKMPYELSGGMQQLVSIVRALILDPDILLLDEPFSCIDEINRAKMHDYLLEIHGQTNKTTIMVTHSLAEAVYLAEKVIVLTPRPSRVKKIFSIDFENRNEAITLSEKFINYIKIIKQELINE